jgi:hypothetical protein
MAPECCQSVSCTSILQWLSIGIRSLGIKKNGLLRSAGCLAPLTCVSHGRSAPVGSTVLIIDCLISKRIDHLYYVE